MYSGTYSRGAHAVWVTQKHMHTHSTYYYLVWVKTKDVQTQYQFRYGNKLALQDKAVQRECEEVRCWHFIKRCARRVGTPKTHAYS